jgi:hypothetical protein
VKRLGAMLLIAAACTGAVAETVPLPHPRPAALTRAPAPGSAAIPSVPVSAQPGQAPSACRLRLTTHMAIAPSVPALTGPGECGAADVVRLEAVVLPDLSRVPLTPPAMLRCSMAEGIVHWVREEAAPRALDLGSPLRAIQNFDSYNCRGRNGVVGARLSEHGKANALDIRALRLADGRTIELTDPQVARYFREGLRESACVRFSTVLGPGSDGYHEKHVHLDLQELRPGRSRMCRWNVRDSGESNPVGNTLPLPLLPPRRKLQAKAGRNGKQ